MATAPAAQQAARTYITTTLGGSIASLELVGMTMTPQGRRIGFEVAWDRGTSTSGAVLGGAVLGLFALAFAMGFGVLLALVGVPPTLVAVLGLLGVGAAVVSGAKSGADATERELLTVTVDGAGDVAMVNRDLSTGEFSRAIDREYDRQTSQFDDAVATLSKHWVLHKLFDRYLDSRKGN